MLIAEPVIVSHSPFHTRHILYTARKLPSVPPHVLGFPACYAVGRVVWTVYKTLGSLQGTAGDQRQELRLIFVVGRPHRRTDGGNVCVKNQKVLLTPRPPVPTDTRLRGEYE